MGFADRVRHMFASKKAELAYSTLTSSALRDNVIAETIAKTPRFRDSANDLPVITGGAVQDDVWSTFPEAMEDAARALFDYEEPKVRHRNEMVPSRLLNREVMARVTVTPEFQEARGFARGHSETALFSAMALGAAMREHAGEAAEHIARSEHMNELEESINQANETLERLRELGRQMAEEGAPPIDVATHSEDVKDVTKERELAKAQLQTLVEAHEASNVLDVAAKIANTTAEKVAGNARAISSLPGLVPGEAQHLSPDQQLAIAEQWASNRQLREIMEMAGRMARDMRFKQQAKTKNVNVEPVGITTGRDIGLMLPHELARAFMPELRPLWIKDYSARALLQYEMSGKAPAGKGPIVAVMDGTGSMDGDKFVWACALVLALMTIAQRQKRAFAVVEFGSKGQVKDWFFPADKHADPEVVLECTSHFFHAGSTDIYSGLERGRQIVATAPEFKTADIVLVTDGICTFGQRDQKCVGELRDMGVRVHGISILAPNNRYMQQACEWQCDVTELAGANEATDVLATNL